MTRPQNVALSWLAATAGFSAALVLAAVGQALGAVLGGCTWIGVSLPLNRPVWALVNEPTIAFAYSGRAWGYWSGSFLLPLVVALAAVPFLPRRRSLAAELTIVQLAWAAAVAGLAVEPLLDPAAGHLGRWLALHQRPAFLLWLAPVAAFLAAVPAALRLLAVGREAEAHAGRGRRLAVVFLHLVLPAAGWLAAVSASRGSPPREAAVALAVPALGALALAWAAYPSRLPGRFERPTAGSWIRLLLAAALLWSLVALAGRPLPGGTNAALLWGRPLATNNLQSWMRPLHLPWNGTAAGERQARPTRVR